MAFIVQIELYDMKKFVLKDFIRNTCIQLKIYELRLLQCIY